ncbi:hypothetical protein KL928_002363 [Ogataea angusta]|uniref:Zn(2)-C6 fungal-type domain-containing protein n=1 Tax=Pichia angusta TaxID=870730 RepID=A0AAN6DG34_PICAN|nr:uncharacterized protein KL928_002363 [Ogataea angusta]KAG7819689.1 hypothetical protein KL928_002363 [Ogataea angusta]
MTEIIQLSLSHAGSGFVDRKGRKRSKNGCMTCKIRKKRCDEQRPSCGACIRLKKDCKYVSEEMTKEEVRQLRRECKILDAERKCRRRKPQQPRIKTEPVDEPLGGNKVVFNPLSVVSTVSGPHAAAFSVWNAFDSTEEPDLRQNDEPGQLASTQFSPLSLAANFSPSFAKFLNELPLDEGRRTPVGGNITPLYLETPPSVASPLYASPSIVTNSPLASLSSVGKQLYEYYRDNLCHVVSVVHKNENMYLRTFLPMAHMDKSVLYGILAWSAFHLGGTRMEQQGQYYINRAIEVIGERPLLPNESRENYRALAEDVEDEELVTKETDEFDDSVALSTLGFSDMINLRLAALMILCGVEICKGDVSKWAKYLPYGASLIKKKGGIRSFNGCKDEHFLVTNYAYHDMMSAAIVEDRQLHFALEEYEDMWIASNRIRFLDPLHGLSSPVFKILAEINQLAVKSRQTLKQYHDPEVPLSEDCCGAQKRPHRMAEVYDKFMHECYALDSKLNEASPNYILMNDMDPADFELQLTMFEAFQLAAKIHLRQSVLRMNPASMEIQYLVDQLAASLDILVGTRLEACICFPVFIAGMNSVYADREQMEARIDDVVKRYRWKNIVRCRLVMREVWKVNSNGERWVDWYEIVRRLGWDLSFA